MLPLNRWWSQTRSLSANHIEDRLFYVCPTLSRREQEVCARAAVGMSVEATAIDLGIAKTSVVTYRKRSYRRLGITSVHELCEPISH